MKRKLMYLVMFLAGFLLALTLTHQKPSRILLMCFNERNETWDRCRMKGKELRNTYEKAEKLGVFCPDLLEE